ncbi:ATP-binding protein [Actinomadura yumaensis]
MSVPRSVSIIPSASALVESLRGLGYSTETALADLVDNSISAEAELIEIDMQWSEGVPVIAMLDDGKGMSEAKLATALCFGGTGARIERDASDLGRFGLGLKTASLSQCRRMTIVSSDADGLNALTLDIDVIADHGWIATVPEVLPAHPFVTRLKERGQGTLVLWERMDERSGLAGLGREDFFLRLQEIRDHLGMVFHRFLGGDARRVSMSINERPIKPWDPFQRTHPATTQMRTERIRHAGGVVTVTPWVLPHRDRFANETEYAAAGGAGGWGARQGFYVYRGKRLLVAGSWVGLGGSRAWTRDEASRLARIEVDLPTTLDSDWRIDVRKSQARPPGALRARLTALAGSCRERAREVFAWRGRRTGSQRTERPTDAVWLARSTDAGMVYTVNREHPAIAAYLADESCDRGRFQAVLTVIERSVPVERIWLDISQSEGAVTLGIDEVEAEQLAAQLASLAELLPSGLSPVDRAEVLIGNLPGDQAELRKHLIGVLEARAA